MLSLSKHGEGLLSSVLGKMFDAERGHRSRAAIRRLSADPRLSRRSKGRVSIIRPKAQVATVVVRVWPLMLGPLLRK